MKLVMDERLKHRLVGLAVVISIAAIFVPAIIKKSNQRFDGKNIASVTLPMKPAIPKITLPEEHAMFKKIKVAHVEIPAFEKQAPVVIAKAQPLSQVHDVKPSVIIAAHALKASELAHSRDAVSSDRESRVVTAKLSRALAKTTVASAVNTKQKVARSVSKARVVARAKNSYSVQLAYFSKQSNAVSLVNKLRGNGFKAYSVKINGKNGMIYKVLVGNTNEKQQAHLLQKQLASSMQLKGFVVPSTGIS